MIGTIKNDNQRSLFFSMGDTLNQNHPLYILSEKVDWLMFEREFSVLYCPDNGAPAKPIRLMVGLLPLKHIRDLSDESVVEQWAENIYYQYFCGQQEFVPKQDHRLSGNSYKGDFGYAINVLLAAAAFNFKRMMNIYKKTIAHIVEQIRAILFLKIEVKRAC